MTILGEKSNQLKKYNLDKYMKFLFYFILLTYKQLYMFYRELHLWIYKTIEKW